MIRTERFKARLVSAMLAALLCIMAPICLPIGVIPISLATFFVYIIGAVQAPLYGFLSVLIYIALGAVGLPVFAGWSGGLSALLGASGGFIIGYLPCVLLQSLILKNRHSRLDFYFASAMVGTVVLYAFGTMWLTVIFNKSLDYALSVCVLPFLVFDIIKIVLSALVSYELNKRMDFLDK